MTPNQDKNAGNPGDVWKHRTILAVVDLLLSKHQGQAPFRYFESHAGKGVYVLRDSKGARQGIHEAIARSTEVKDPYILAESNSVASGHYLGSWKLVSELFSARAAPAHLELWDRDLAVLDAARANATAQHELHFHNGDGFGAAPLAEADLYFIDPFDSWSRSATVALQLAEKNFLIWYAIAANSRPNELVRKTGLTGFEALWSPIHPHASPTLRGCGLLFSRSLHVLLPCIANDFLAFSSRLGWQLHLRVPWEVA